MTDRILIPLPGVGTLALTTEQLREALAHGGELIASPAPSASAVDDAPLLDSKAAAEKLGVTSRWLEDMTRAGVVPHYKFGRFVRYNVREIAAHFRVDGAPATDSRFVEPLRGYARQ